MPVNANALSSSLGCFLISHLFLVVVSVYLYLHEITDVDDETISGEESFGVAHVSTTRNSSIIPSSALEEGHSRKFPHSLYPRRKFLLFLGCKCDQITGWRWPRRRHVPTYLQGSRSGILYSKSLILGYDILENFRIPRVLDETRVFCTERILWQFTTLSMVICFSMGTLGIFATLVYVFTMRVVIYDILSMAIIPILATSILFCNLCYILLWILPRSVVNIAIRI